MPAPPRAYLVRHAQAEGGNPGGDPARRLTAEGRARFLRLLVALEPELRGHPVVRILASPLLRARQTADLLSRATGAPVVLEEALASGASGARALLELAAGGGGGLALVGHNPELGEAISLAAGRTEEVGAGTVAALELLADGARLAWVRRTEG